MPPTEVGGGRRLSGFPNEPGQQWVVDRLATSGSQTPRSSPPVPEDPGRTMTVEPADELHRNSTANRSTASYVGLARRVIERLPSVENPVGQVISIGFSSRGWEGIEREMTLSVS